MTKEEYLDFCGSIAGATYDQPFNEDFQSTALRHWDTKKWFGLLMLHNDRWIVNLKLKPEEVYSLKGWSYVAPAIEPQKSRYSSFVIKSPTFAK